MSVLQIVFAFPAPIALALLLNSIMSERVKRSMQIDRLPAALHRLGDRGLDLAADARRRRRGQQPAAQRVGLATVNIMGNPDCVQAAGHPAGDLEGDRLGHDHLPGRDARRSRSELYEAAAVDGAGPWRRIWHVTLPGMRSVIVLLLILRLGSVLTRRLRADPAAATDRSAPTRRGAGHVRLLPRHQRRRLGLGHRGRPGQGRGRHRRWCSAPTRLAKRFGGEGVF